MKRYDKSTPEGMDDLLFAECNAQKEAMNALHNTFSEAGYHQVVTPGFEFYDVFSSSEMYYPQESMYKLIDDKGRIMVARPDSTIPIARLVSTRLKGCALPLKLYYGQSIYRKNPGLSGRNNEIMQMGVERIGESSFDSDMEVIFLGAKALSNCDADDYRIEIGHVGIFNLLMESLTVDQEQKSRIHEFIASKNYAALSAKLDRLPESDSSRILRELPRLFGGEEAILKAKKLFAGSDPRLTEMLTYLENLLLKIQEAGLSQHFIVDLGLVNQADYYSSIVFRGYVDSIGEPVLSGGRYDELFKDFGNDLPAVGFGINVDVLATYTLRKKEEKENGKPDKSRIRIALTKGRLEKDTLKMFETMGFDCGDLEDKGRKLFVSIPGQAIDVVFAKAADVITYVENGVCDMGIVGMDTILESGGTFYEVLNLGFGKCKFVLAAPQGVDFYKGYATKRIATKYPKIAREFFDEQAMDVRVIKIEGSVELAPLLALADGIVDIVSTGTTLKENGLVVVDEIREVSARLIVNEASMKLKRDPITELVDKMEERVKAGVCKE